MSNIQPTKENSKQYYSEHSSIGCDDCVYAKDCGVGYECTKDGGPKFFIGTTCLFKHSHKCRESTPES